MSTLLEQPQTNDHPVPTESAAAAPEPTSKRRPLWKYVASLFDQGVVSGTRFATSILVGACCGATELGLYALGFSILLACGALHISVFCRPFTIFGNQMEQQQRNRLAGSVLIQFLVFCGFVSGGLAAAVAGLTWYQVDTPLIPILLVLAAGAPFLLARDHARQYGFAVLNVRLVTIVDTIAAVLQLSGLAVLAWTGQLSAVSALAIASVACGVSAAVWLWAVRRDIRVQLSAVWPDLKRQWVIGKWDCASEVAFALQIQGMTWLLAALLDTRTVGIYAACMMTIQILNPVLLGINSVLVPRTTQAFASGGLAGLDRFVRQTMVLFTLVTFVFAIPAGLLGPPALEYIYRDQGILIPVAVVVALLIGNVIEILGVGFENGMWAIERHDLNFRVHLVGCIATCISAWLLVSAYGLMGAALSFCVGRSVTTVAQWLAYRSGTRQRAAMESV